MTCKTLASGFASLPIAIVAGICLAYQVQHSDRHPRPVAHPQIAAPLPSSAAMPGLPGAPGKVPTELSLAPIPEMATKAKIPLLVKSGATPTSQSLDAFISLLANSLKATRSSAGADRLLPATIPGSGKPKAMTMLSISCYEESENMAAQTLSIRCRTCGSFSNAAGSDHIVVKGVVTEDIVSVAGKILISAGSKVAGIGHIDFDTGRLKSRGNWSIFAGTHELRVQAEMKDAEAGFPGLVGKETSSESELTQRQAVVRDGRYYFLADKTPFVLSLKGEVGLKELKTLEAAE